MSSGKQVSNLSKVLISLSKFGDVSEVLQTTNLCDGDGILGIGTYVLRKNTYLFQCRELSADSLEIVCCQLYIVYFEQRPPYVWERKLNTR